MIRFFLDTNILVDAFLRGGDPVRDQDHHDAVALITELGKGHGTGIITPASMATVIYFLQGKANRIGIGEVHRAINWMLDVMQWAPMHPEHFRAALDHPINDIEDAAQLIAAHVTRKIDAVVSRDKDFVVKGVKVLTAAQALRKLKR
jgi:predicted nucleic acid-binding protein